MQSPYSFLLAAFAAFLPAMGRAVTLTDLIADRPLIDIQCEGDTGNAGSLTLAGPNGETGTGDDSYNGLISESSTGIINIGTSGLAAWNPASQAVDLDYCPYIAARSITDALGRAGAIYPTAWTLVARVMMPEAENTVVLAIGENHRDSGHNLQGALVVTTGALAEERGDSASGDDRTGDEVRFWHIPGTVDYAHASQNQVSPLATQKVACATDSYHLLTVRHDAGEVTFFLNDRLIAKATVADAIAPGIQFGQLLGGEAISEAFRQDRFETVGNITNDGGIDFLLFYDRALTDAEVHGLARAYPYIHRDGGYHGNAIRYEDSTVRYIRRIEGGKTENWRQENAWVRQYTWDGQWWPDLDGADDPWFGESPVEANRYDEPAEGAIVAIECLGEGRATLLVNTERGGLFPSADRTYAQLDVSGEGMVEILPCEGWESAADAQSITLDPTRASGYRYGSLHFTGSANDALGLETTGYEATHTGIFRTDAEVAASVCDLSNDTVTLRGGPSVTFLADAARARGLAGPVIDCRLTRQISGEGQDGGALVANPEANADYGQVSTLVYVETYRPEDTWLITDTTDANAPGSVVFAADGLSARYTNQDFPLYLDLADKNASGTLAGQNWRRGAYDGEKAADGDSGVAAHLHIRLADGQDDALTLDTAKRAKALIVEMPLSDAAGAEESLSLIASGEGDLLTLSEALTVDGRLAVYADGRDAVAFADAALTGAGTLAAGATTFGEASIAAIESRGTLIFTQDLPSTGLSAVSGATLTATRPIAAKSLTLADGSRLDCATATDTAPAFTVGTVEAVGSVRVKAPEGAHEGLVFLRTEETEADMASRAAFDAAHQDGNLWDIRLRVNELGSDYSFDAPGLAVPVNPTDTADGNVWPEAVEDALIDAYQAANLIGGGAEGYTRAKTKTLSAEDIAAAYGCFGGVAAFATSAKALAARLPQDGVSDDGAVADLLMAYEFGISRVTLAQAEDGQPHALVEVTLRNDLGTHFADRAFVDVSAPERTPSYAEGTELVFFVNGQRCDATEDASGRLAAGRALIRRFRIPLTALPEGSAQISVRAIRPE